MWRMPSDFVSHVFHVYFSHGFSVYLSTCISVGYQVKFEDFLTCNLRCISQVEKWCTFSGVFHENCFTWINGVPVHLDIRGISWEECHLILFHLFSTCVFHMDYWCSYPRVGPISGGYHVMFEPRFPSDVYSTWIIGVGSMVRVVDWEVRGRRFEFRQSLICLNQ